MKRLLLAVIVAAAFTGSASAAVPVLHTGSHGQRVKNLQWLLAGHNPTHYSTIHPLKGRKPNGVYGKRTAEAVASAKWRLGYPALYVNRVAGPLLFRILLGKTKRPIRWIQIAAKRQAFLEHEEAAAKVSACQRQVVHTAESQLGVHEIPDGSNWGPQVADYQAVTGAYHAPWCASFAQWVLVHSGYGPFANRSAGVFYIRDWAYQRGLLRATPRPGVLVLFLNSTGHMGVVESVVQGGFYSIEGNTSNMVGRRYHPFTSSTVFVYLPHCSDATRIVNPPTVSLGLFHATPLWLILVGSILGGVFWFMPQPHIILRNRRRNK